MNRWRREYRAGNPACRAQAPGHGTRNQAPRLPPWQLPSNWRAHAAHYLNEAGQLRRGLVVRQIGARTVATEARTPNLSGARVCVYTAEHLRLAVMWAKWAEATVGSAKIDRAAIHRAFLPA